MINENDFFRQATLLICSSLKVDTALKRLMVYLQEFMPVSGVAMGTYDPEMNVARVLSVIWPPSWKKPPDTISFSRELSAYMCDNWRGEPQIKVSNDIEDEDPAIRPMILNLFPEDSSRIHMDLELETERLGVLTLFAEGKQRYTQEHSRLIALLHDPLAVAISNILQYREITRLRDLLTDDNRYLRRELRAISGDHIVGADFGLRHVMQMVRQVSSLNSPVLLLGETGVGKEVVANAVHEGSGRNDKPFVKVNCGAIPEGLIDSELFGHEKGAFTGAVSLKRGRFERAHTGTIFLDEIGELPWAAQVRLLRVLQQHEVERVGGSDPIPVDVRIISATHRNLEAMVRAGTFREDLWFRLNVFPVNIPPLRQRTEDIPALVSYFIEKKSRELNIWNPPPMASGTMAWLQSYSWPGNVRELENLVERALIHSLMHEGNGSLTFDRLSINQAAGAIQPKASEPEDIRPLNEVIAEHIQWALRITHKKVEGKGGAANLLGIHPSTLRARMRKLGIPYGKKATPSV
jgi:formate hydrogenlyase transcriptional activator